MKKLMAATLLTLALGLGSAMAASQTVDVYQYSVGGTINWTHSYLGAPGPATLTIVADDVDLGEQDMVRLKVGDIWHNLGFLKEMGFYTDWEYHPGAGNPDYPDAITTTVFTLDPAWLSGNMPIQVAVASSWGVEIETSTLTVAGVPEAGSSLLLLGCSLLGIAGLRKRLG